MPIDPCHYTFDLYRIFFGEYLSFPFLAEIVFRITIIYFYTLANIRIFHTRSMAQLTIFDLIIVIALGPAIGDTMFYHKIPLINGMITISAIVIFTKLVSLTVENISYIEELFEGKPILVIKHGKIISENLQESNLSQEDLYARLRSKGIRNTGQIEYAFIETSGQISILTYETPISGVSTLNHLE